MNHNEVTIAVTAKAVVTANYFDLESVTDTEKYTEALREYPRLIQKKVNSLTRIQALALRALAIHQKLTPGCTAKDHEISEPRAVQYVQRTKGTPCRIEIGFNVINDIKSTDTGLSGWDELYDFVDRTADKPFSPRQVDDSMIANNRWIKPAR